MFDDHGFYRFAVAQPGPLGVLFTAPACGACKHVRALLEGLELPYPFVEVDAASSPGLVAEHEVFHLPALFLYVDGDLHREISAEATASSLLAAITEAPSLPPTEPG